MDWNLAIERNREALKRIVAMLVAMAGLGAPTALPAFSTAPYCDCFGRPEAAARRLIVIAARGLVVVAPPHIRTSKPGPASIFVRNGVGTGIFVPPGVVMPPGSLPGGSPRPAPRCMSLPLLDPLSRPFRRRRPAASGVPRVSFPGFGAPFPVAVRRPPSPDDPLDATRLVLRLRALTAALDDLPRQARRFARWRARGAGAQDRTRRFSPLRPGGPPGWRRRPDHAVHELLNELHGLAFDVLKHPDTS